MSGDVACQALATADLPKRVRIRRTQPSTGKEVATVTANWREVVASSVGVRASEITRMASAFEHEELTRALAL